MIQCPGCLSKNYTFKDTYKTLLKEDNIFLSNISLYQCNNCELGFAAPMPKDSDLQRYYENTYGGHYLKDNHRYVHLNGPYHAQFCYISQFIDFHTIKNVIDVGPGSGFLLKEIRHHHKNIHLTACDLDLENLKHLEKECVQLIKMDLHSKNPYPVFTHTFDLIISAHSVEHMPDPHIFFEFVKQNLSPQGKVFLEVPHCPLTPHAYLPRPYDEPHVLFFNETALRNLVKRKNLQIIHMATAGNLLKNQLIAMSQKHSNIHPPFSPKQWIRNTLKKYGAGEMVQTLKYRLKIRSRSYLNHYQYGGNRWTLRSIIANSF